MRALLLAAVLPAAGCAAHLSGVVLNAAYEDPRPVPTATVLVAPVAPLPSARDPNPAAVAPELRAEVEVDEEGRFRVTSLLDEDGGRHPIPPGWAYEVRAEAIGYYSSVERAELRRGGAEVRLRLHEIEELGMDGALRIEAAPSGRIDDLEGGLVDEILRRQDRLPPR